MTETGFRSSVENSLFLRYDYADNTLFCCDDPTYEKLQSIQDVYNYIVEYFLSVGEDYNPRLSFRKIRSIGTVIEFDFPIENSRVHSGIIYTTNPEEFNIESHLEGNWYVYTHMVP